MLDTLSRTPLPLSASSLAALHVTECARDLPGVSLPHAETHIVVRFGPSARGGVDAYAMGPRRHAHRKVVRAGQRTVIARLRLGTHEAVLGVPASAIAGRLVALEEFWGAEANRLLETLAESPDALAAAATLEQAIARHAQSDARRESPLRLALAAAERLPGAQVGNVAAALGVSERHLRRVFREALGMSPKAYAQLARFDRALLAASGPGHADWATIAADAGYFDQAHLIAEFRGIAGATPRTLLNELEAGRLDVPGPTRRLPGSAPAQAR